MLEEPKTLFFGLVYFLKVLDDSIFYFVYFLIDYYIWDVQSSKYQSRQKFASNSVKKNVEQMNILKTS